MKYECERERRREQEGKGKEKKRKDWKEGLMSTQIHKHQPNNRE